jgi:sugar phosphate isomerase/epimerase
MFDVKAEVVIVSVRVIAPVLVEQAAPRRWSIAAARTSARSGGSKQRSTKPRRRSHDPCPPVRQRDVTYTMPFADELALWEELEMRHVGLLAQKVEAHGREDATQALRKRDITATTVITAAFDLSDPATWDVTRASLRSAVDLAAKVGGCVYFTPGRRDGHRTFDDLTDALAAAVAPCIGYAEDHDVRLAIEPSLRTDVSFVHTLRDGLDVAARAGINVIADIGNCWMERDVEQTVRLAGPRLAAVQIGDALYGTLGQALPGGRAVPGDGDLDIGAFIRAALEAG